MNLVFDNLIFYIQNNGGGSVYWYELITRFLQTRDENNIKYLKPKDRKGNTYSVNFEKEKNINFEVEPYSPKLLMFKKYFNTSNEKFIFHSSYYRISKNSKSINVVTIHDLIPELYFTGIKKMIHSYIKKRALINANGIVCVSKNTKEDLHKIYPFSKQIPTEVIYNGVSNDFYYNPNSKEIEKPYILFVGRRSGYKNFDFAIEVLKNQQEYKFFIVGSSLSENEKNQLEKNEIRYKLFENISNEELNTLYNNAFCLLYPSSYEGFGIPVLEAQKAGCPVIALNRSSVAEIGENSAILVDELNVKLFKEQIENLKNDEYRNQVVYSGLENAKKYNWDDKAKEYLNFYKRLYES